MRYEKSTSLSDPAEKELELRDAPILLVDRGKLERESGRFNHTRVSTVPFTTDKGPKFPRDLTRTPQHTDRPTEYEALGDAIRAKLYNRSTEPQGGVKFAPITQFKYKLYPFKGLANFHIEKLPTTQETGLMSMIRKNVIECSYRTMLGPHNSRIQV